MEVSVQLHAPTSSFSGEEPGHPFNRRLNGPWNQPGSFGQKKFYTPSGNQTLYCPNCSQVTVQTTLSRGAGIAWSVWRSLVRTPAVTRYFSILWMVHTSYGTNVLLSLMGIRVSLLGSKAAGAWSDHLPPSGAKVSNEWSRTFIPPYMPSTRTPGQL